MPTIIYIDYETSMYWASVNGQCVKYPCGWRVEASSVNKLKEILANEFPFCDVIKVVPI